jgi:hypothetical protein
VPDRPVLPRRLSGAYDYTGQCEEGWKVGEEAVEKAQSAFPGEYVRAEGS